MCLSLIILHIIISHFTRIQEQDDEIDREWSLNKKNLN